MGKDAVADYIAGAVDSDNISWFDCVALTGLNDQLIVGLDKGQHASPFSN